MIGLLQVLELMSPFLLKGLTSILLLVSTNASAISLKIVS
jgi:hypothetical protein